VAEAFMSDDELQRRMIDAALTLIIATTRYGQHGCFAATCTDDTGKSWQITVQPARVVPAVNITPPVPVVFSQN
jgi:hypothetical protein